MNEKLKKFFLSFAVRSAVALAVFIAFAVVKRFFPEIFSECSRVWAKSIDTEKIGALLKALAKEVI